MLNSAGPNIIRYSYDQSVNIPIELYESLNGNYFMGYGDNLSLGNGTSAWARLYNPPNSGVNLYVNVWTVTDISDSPFRAQFWFNATPPKGSFESVPVTPSNTAIRPVPHPRVQLQVASNVSGEPTGGVKAFVRRGESGTTVVDTENGKLIFPPGGSFLVFLSVTEDVSAAAGRIAFGWWEEKISCFAFYTQKN
ncbi:hypothetical protein FL966_04630 [Caproiciproducens galactitolivorans]|uniref:Uncharacterized protein n=1 Tax=Caproiciproducens galactitolivorans TaxID=642589 RepID=A0A4Z0YF38_9FIRM|nr:DUF6143 family protein [Caproiciproducens galactitolivorans]QEY34396.1 hypothetical protein FL966_04630 [Caproiciproducens galactitolivorans]TGJ77831.1 hypothetical protein CAGA_02350 [Caproiciproducens galactitolivorans]